MRAHGGTWTTPWKFTGVSAGLNSQEEVLMPSLWPENQKTVVQVRKKP